MDINKIDKRLADNEYEYDGNLNYYTIPCEEFSLHGVSYNDVDKRFERVPFATAEKISSGVAQLSRMLTGGRILFATDSDVIELVVKCQDCSFRFSTITTVSGCGISLHEICDDGWWQFIHNFIPKNDDKFGYSSRQKLKGGKMRKYILHLSLYQDAKSIQIGLAKDSKVELLSHYRDVKPILYYGSSVTQGCCVSRPDMTYQALISKWNNIDFVNQGYSGNAHGEVLMADYLTSTYDPSLFVCAYDYNAETVDFLKETHYNFYERIRKGFKNLPILFVSRADTDSCPDNVKKRKEIILDTINKAKASGDNNVFFIDGATFFGDDDRDKCTIDDCHPNDIGAYRIAKNLYKKMIEIDKKFE